MYFAGSKPDFATFVSYKTLSALLTPRGAKRYAFNSDESECFIIVISIIVNYISIIIIIIIIIIIAIIYFSFVG